MYISKRKDGTINLTNISTLDTRSQTDTFVKVLKWVIPRKCQPEKQSKLDSF